MRLESRTNNRAIIILARSSLNPAALCQLGFPGSLGARYSPQSLRRNYEGCKAAFEDYRKRGRKTFQFVKDAGGGWC